MKKSAGESANIWEQYDFQSLTEFFDYILESHTNGNFTQVNQLISELTRQQQAEFIRHCYFGDASFNEKGASYCIDQTLTALEAEAVPAPFTIRVKDNDNLKNCNIHQTAKRLARVFERNTYLSGYITTRGGHNGETHTVTFGVKHTFDSMKANKFI